MSWKRIGILVVMLLMGSFVRGEEIFLRANQVGYLPGDAKVAMAFSKSELPGDFEVVSERGGVVLKGKAKAIAGSTWGEFSHHAELDFSSLRAGGSYVLKIGDALQRVRIGDDVYSAMPGQLLEFMREQRCGFNPWLEMRCHQMDGRTAYGPRASGSAIDVTGGWHDAGDMLKYLVTSEDATAEMLLAWEMKNPAQGPALNKTKDALLDEAQWGLEWMLKMHPSANELYHQVGDDRDHAGWRLPDKDQVDYGWGKGEGRVAYFADGKPQGLRQYKSESDGVANLAGVYAAGMGLAYQVWHDDPAHKDFADRCLKAGKEVYEMGKRQEGVQQGNSYGSPYRYSPTIWACDMEWGAAELFRATGQKRYLDEAVRYAKLAANDTWMGQEQTKHYQYFPFINLGHYRLYDLVDTVTKKKLAEYYRVGIAKCVGAGEKNPYRIGVPFIWCSNNLAEALATQCELYERMTGDKQFEEFGAKQRDWLLGRNPWDICMYTKMGEQSPRDVHLMTVQLLHRLVGGALVDGPVYARIFHSLSGVTIRQPDPFAEFQGEAVYHDDGLDYSTNEPTLDGTASGILMAAGMR